MRSIVRSIKLTGRFDRDFQRELSGVLGRILTRLLGETVSILAADHPLPPRYRDHALSGEWKDFRDCHIRPDLILIYRKTTVHTASSQSHEGVLELVRLGSHSELGL
jgi:mRNA interferase YafQ